jgi:hypothetical protein
MKKMTFVLAVLLFAAPAWATDVTVTATQVGDTNQVEISYSADVNLPRAFGLDITVTDGNIVACEPNMVGECTATVRGFGIFPGTIRIHADGYVTDDGTPAAPSDDPGALGGVGTNGITIEMGSLYVDGNEPPLEGVLCTITVTENCTVNIAGNAARCGEGSPDLGVVMENVDEVAIVSYVPCDVTLPPSVCVGDVDGNGAVNRADIMKLINFLVDNASPPFWVVPDTNPAYSAAADVDGNGAVNRADIMTLINFLVDNAEPPFWTVPCP